MKNKTMMVLAGAVMVITSVMLLTGCTALKGLVKSVEDALNNAMDGAHGTVTNAASVATAPLK